VGGVKILKTFEKAEKERELEDGGKLKR